MNVPPAILTILCVCLLHQQTHAAALIQDSLTFSSCGGSSDPFTVGTIDVTPYPLIPGKDVMTELSFDSSKDVDGGSITVSISGGFLPFTRSYDLCSVTSCPIKAGQHKFNFEQSLPGFIPSGTYGVKIEGVDKNKEQLFCTKMDVEIQKH